jgi:uncharacterized caspase-like protein
VAAITRTACVAVWLLGMLFQEAAYAQSRRVALVIGNSQYAVQPLANAANDATAMAETFRITLGFDSVTLKLNVTRLDLVKALQAFESQAANAEVAVVYFAGHGTAVDQIDTYLVPIDARLAREADLDDEAVSLKSVLRRLDGVRGLRLIILDACRNTPFALAGQKRSGSRGLGRIEPDDDTLIAYATKDGSTADDGVGQNSPFTAALLKHIATPGIDVSFVFRRVRDEVMSATGRKQQPHLYGTLGARPIYLKRGTQVAAAESVAARPDVAVQPPASSTVDEQATRDRIRDQELARQKAAREQAEAAIRAREQEQIRLQAARLKTEAELAATAEARRQAAARAEAAQSRSRSRTIVTYRISSEVSQGVHNLRSGPGISHSLVVPIPAKSSGVEVETDSCRPSDDGKGTHRWCRSTWRGQTGWLSMSGLVR